jgi:hypothetical protein
VVNLLRQRRYAGVTSCVWVCHSPFPGRELKPWLQCLWCVGKGVGGGAVYRTTGAGATRTFVPSAHPLGDEGGA